MASNTIKGLTVEIGGDTTKLGKALEGVNKKSRDLSSELGEINRLLKLDPGNTELLEQKQKVLADAIANTAEKLGTLKEAEKQAQEQFERGEVSEEQVRALQREIIATAKKLDGYEKAARETADEIDRLGSESQDTAGEIDKLGTESKDTAANIDDLGDSAEDTGGILENISNGGLKTLFGAVTAATAALVASAESSRDYRQEMGKLDTAFTTAGHSSEAAKNTYKALQGVLGETDQAVEAANHLAQLVDNETDLAKWTDIATGVYATFGASLPIEGLTEAANETAKVGTLTGSLADALNWAGVNEEEFQAKLDECNTEQERQALITETLNGLYATAAERYRETNAEVIKANEANEALAASNAEIGAEVEPVLNEIKALGAELLTKLLPVVQWILDNLPTVGIILAGVTASMVAFKVASIAATAATQGLTLAQYAAAAAQKVLNAVMSANPLGLIILAITAVIAAISLMVKNWDSVSKFLSKLWDNIKNVVKRIGDAFEELVKKAVNVGVDLVKGLWKGISETATWLKNKIKGWVGDVTKFLKKLFGINSPSKVTAYMGEMLDEGFAKGIEDNAKKPLKAMGDLSQDMLNEASGVDGLAIERRINHTYSANAQAATAQSASMLGKLDQIYKAIRSGQTILLDGKTLVGSTAERYDNEFGRRRVLVERGAL